MTFDRFMKEFLAEEFKDFPNTVYKYDCWYSFTPQGVMHQVFVFRSRSGGIDLHYGATPMIAPLIIVAGNGLKKPIFDRPDSAVCFEYAKHHPELEYGIHSEVLDIRAKTVQEPQKADMLHKMTQEFIIPYFALTNTMQDLYKYCMNRAAQALAGNCVKNGFDVRPHLSDYYRFGEAPYALSYLHKYDEALEGIKKRRDSAISRLYANAAYWKERNQPIDERDLQTALNNCERIEEDGEKLLLLPEEEQQRRLREIFEENRVKIRDLLKIEPEFDMDFIFPEG